jgi:hypothetical protein
MAKFTNAQIQALKEAGNIVKGNLVIPLSFLESAAPERVRTSLVERQGKLASVVQGTPANDAGVRTVSVIALMDAGLPVGSVANPTYWSGLGDGSVMAFELGYKSRHASVRVGDNFQMSVILTPLTDDDCAAHEKRVAKRAAKTAASEPASDEGAAAPVDDGAGATA